MLSERRIRELECEISAVSISVIRSILLNAVLRIEVGHECSNPCSITVLHYTFRFEIENSSRLVMKRPLFRIKIFKN